jgi:predicted regulator of Ras-like GTPase activity (Roadblock/LC7/MglB family)
LQEIPKEPELKLEEIPVVTNESDESELNVETVSETKQPFQEDKIQGLQEIPPKPFQSPILSSSKDTISDAFSELKQSILDDKEEEPKPALVPITAKPMDNKETASKQMRLEKDMTEVLSFLSKKISVKKLDSKAVAPPPKKEIEKKLPPSSMNEILNELINLDSRIEASAIIKTDGTMLASAISSRISESLFNTIGMNLSMIGADIIHGLSAGSLKSISVKGTEGILDLAPIDTEAPNLKDMILILFSHPKVKSGIISIAINVIKKQIKYYMGLEN